MSGRAPSGSDKMLALRRVLSGVSQRARDDPGLRLAAVAVTRRQG
jgi:hypothetical protein